MGAGVSQLASEGEGEVEVEREGEGEGEREREGRLAQPHVDASRTPIGPEPIPMPEPISIGGLSIGGISIGPEPIPAPDP